MQAFKTTLANFSFPLSISYDSRVLGMGSCFAEHILRRLDQLKFDVDLNPFGILYNPLSIAHSLKLVNSSFLYQQENLFFDKNLWHSFDHHSEFSALSPEQTLLNINQRLERLRQQKSKINRLILTFGTAYTWVLKEENRLVANCHKLAKSNFERRLLSIEEIVSELSAVLKSWKKNNPELECLISVSPVRHLRDGMVNNQKSKSILLLAAHQIVESLNFVHYFPAYEIFMDDLRDYRFYADDLIHPSKLGIVYVWNYFYENLIAENSKKQLQSIDKINKALHHRPLFPGSATHRKFIEATIQFIEEFEQKNPQFNFEEEKQKLIS